MTRKILIVIALTLLSHGAHAERLLTIYNEQEPQSLDPALATGKFENFIDINIFDGLVEFDSKDGPVHPSLAEKWTISPDGKTYTFTLRKNATWSDGTPITATDFVYSWERALNPATGSEYAGLLFTIVGTEAYNLGKSKDAAALGFKAKDPHTLVVTLTNPTPYFLDTLGMPVFRVVPKQAIEKFGVQWTHPEHIVTSGAFLLKSWVPHKEITVMRNPAHWDAANTHLSGAQFLPVGDHETAYKMYLSGTMDALFQMSVPRLKELIAHPISGFHQGPYLGSYYYAVNATKPPYDNPKVRMALALAIDRDAVATQFLQGTYDPLGTLTPKPIPGYTPPAGISMNVQKARQLLAEAGYADPSQFPPLELHFNTDEIHREVAQVLQQMLKQNLGITVTLRNEEWKVYLSNQHRGDFQVSRFTWIADYADPTTFLDLLRSNDPNNRSRWKNPTYDALMARAAREVNTSRRAELLAQAEKLALDNVPFIPVMQWKNFAIIRPGIEGMVVNLLDRHPLKFVQFSGLEWDPWADFQHLFKTP